MGGILGLFGVVTAAAMVDLLLPEKEGIGTKKYLHILTALAVLLLIASPVFSWLSRFDGELPPLSLGEVEEGAEELFQSVLDAEGDAAFREGIARKLCERFEMKKECLAVAVTYEGREPTLVRVKLSGAALLKDPDKIEVYLEELLGIPAEVR